MWKQAIMTPASVSSVSALAVLAIRPISVTPVTSRVVERLVVRDYSIPNVSQVVLN